MAEPRCALCGIELETSNDSGEHLIPNSIGGRRKVFGVCCVGCNNKTGILWDAEVARQLQFLTLKLGVVRDRGGTQTGEFATVTGTPVRIHADGRLSFPPSKPVVVEEGEVVRIQFRARTRAEATKTLRGLKRKYPKLDIDAALENLVEDEKYLAEPIVGSCAFGGPRAGRSVVKSALTLAVSTGVDAPCCNLALAYLQSENGPPCFGYYHRRDLVTNRPKDTVFHCVAIQGDPGTSRLIGYVELYSIYRMVIGLSDHYTGPAVVATYAITPTDGAELSLNVDLSFTDEELRFALANEDDVGPAQLKAFGEVMEIAQQISFEREQSRVARRAYSTTLSKLGLEPGQKMTPEIALAMSKEITEQMIPFLQHHISSRRRR